jgi:hypothetical protein
VTATAVILDMVVRDFRHRTAQIIHSYWLQSNIAISLVDTTKKANKKRTLALWPVSVI